MCTIANWTHLLLNTQDLLSSPPLSNSPFNITLSSLVYPHCCGESLIPVVLPTFGKNTLRHALSGQLFLGSLVWSVAVKCKSKAANFSNKEFKKLII